MEKAITFENSNGNKLFGIIHIPEQSISTEMKIGVNLLNPGIKYRVAPNRLNVKLARQLCQRGYYVFRFDPEGIGDSEGELPGNLLLAEIGELIQTGAFVNDTVVANNYFIEYYGINKLIMIGNCGGAITSLITSNKDSRINALCLIDVPVNFRDAKMTFADKADEGGEKASWLFYEYVKRLFRLESWYRFVSFKTNYRAMWKTINMKFRKSLGLSENNNILPDKLEALCQDRKLNRLFFESVEKIIENEKRVLFILAGNDPGTEIFQRYFQNGYLKEKLNNENRRKLNEVFIIGKANHVYTLIKWQSSLISKVCQWIDSFALKEV